MNEVLIFTFKYISPIFLLAILLWRFKGKFDWIFPSIVIVVVSINLLPSFFLPNPKHNEFKDEIISLAKMKKENIHEKMDRQNIEEEKVSDDIFVYPADKRGDYYTYYFKKNLNLKFIIAFKEPKKYDRFFDSVDSLMVKGLKPKGCITDTVYKLDANCYVCKGGFDIDTHRYLLKVSQSLDFTIPDSKSPKSKSSNNTHNTPNPFNPPFEVMRPPKRRGEYMPNAVDSATDALNGRLENKRLKKAGGEEDGG